jgi:hypothetical protein
MGEVCLDASKRGAFGVSLLSFARFDRPLPPFARGNGDLPLLKASKGAILAPKAPESGECRIRKVVE